MIILTLRFRKTFNSFYKSIIIFYSLEILVIIIKPLAFMNVEKLKLLLIFLYNIFPTFLLFLLLNICLLILFFNRNFLFIYKLLYLLKRLLNLRSEFIEGVVLKFNIKNACNFRYLLNQLECFANIAEIFNIINVKPLIIDLILDDFNKSFKTIE